MRRYLDTFFRHPLLFLLPPLVVLAATVVLTRRAIEGAPGYTAEATLAVNLDPTRSRGLGDRPPSEQNAELLGELMGTDSFILAALRRTSLARPDSASDYGLAKDVRRHWKQRAAGPNTIRVAYSCDEPERCAEVVAAVLAEFTEQARVAALAGRVAAVELYQQQLDSINRQLRETPATDPARDSVRKALEEINGKLIEARVDLAREQQTREAEVRVLSPPRVPEGKTGVLRVVALPIMAGVVLVALLFLGPLLLATWTDSTLRTPDDALARLGLRTVAVVPHDRRYAKKLRAAWQAGAGALSRRPWRRSASPMPLEEKARG